MRKSVRFFDVQSSSLFSQLKSDLETFLNYKTYWAEGDSEFLNIRINIEIEYSQRNAGCLFSNDEKQT